MRRPNGLAVVAALALAMTAGPAAPAGAAGAPPGPAAPRAVGFDRHVEALLGRLGCNAGACHGSSRGKGGLKLSLFGADPAADHAALTRGRVDTDNPAHSLLLRKPTGQVRHGGGRRLEPGSWEYRVLLRWAEQGAKRGPAGPPRRLSITPGELRLAGPAAEGELRVTAEFAGGGREDVTRFCTFRAGDEAVAEVDGTGRARGRRPGVTFVVAGYGGVWAHTSVLVPRPVPAGFTYPDIPPHNVIDGVVLRRLRRLNVVPSSPCSDAEFLRRVTIDVTGSLPPPDEVRNFLAGADPSKRARKVEELLASPRHAALWATKFCDWTACDIDALEEPADLRPARARMWHDWFRKRVQENVPYDRLVRGVLGGTTRGGRGLAAWMTAEIARLEAARARGADPGYADRPFLDLYWRRLDGAGPVPPERMGELTAAAFLGLRLQCAQCHRHPADRWTQTDYRAFTNVFARVRFGQSPELRDAVIDLLEARRAAGAGGKPLPRLQEMYLESGTERYLTDPATGKPLPPRPPGGPALNDRADPREGLVAWMVSPGNPYFARNFANRVWQHYFGRGLVEAADEFSDARPPEFPELLDVLAAEFVKGGYDVRRLERLILNSRTYQLSSAPNETNAEDESGLARFRARRPMSEVVADLLHDACGATPDYRPDAPAGARATEVVTNRPLNPLLGRVARSFGRPARRQLCDCERRAEPVLAECLMLMSDPALLELTRRGRVARLCGGGVTDGAAVEGLYLAALSRPPSADERAAALDYLRRKVGRRAGLEGLLWVLLNTREFILVH
jgi:hypothetical protein